MLTQGKFLDILRSRISLSEIIGEKVKLTRKGREFIGLCPFHHEKTPSFTVNDEKEFYHCFGCGAHGDVIRFLTEIHRYSFLESVKELASRAGLTLPSQFSLQKEETQKDLPLVQQILQEATQWFHRNLFLIKHKEALRYTEQRGLTQETLKKFSIGYAPNDYHILEIYLKEKGFSEDLLLKTGLLAQAQETSKVYDRFRGRLMFPIQDHKGHIVAFGGRLISKGEPKYLNSPETPFFSKGKLLYGYYQAKDKAPSDPLLIVEGYMDVISLHQAGFKGAVAPLGTALTEDQIRLAWRLSPEPILCFDGDAAGLKAASRAAERVLPLLKPGYSLRFIFLPQGEDPDSLIQKGMLSTHIFPQAYSLLDTLWMFLTHGKTFKTPEQKAALEKQYSLWSQAIQDPGVRKNYQYAFKDLFYKNIIKRNTPSSSRAVFRPKNINFLSISERLLLAILINHPNLLDEVSDDFAFLELKDQRLDDVREAILHFYAKGTLKEMDLKTYLLHKGFEEDVKNILSPQILIHAAFSHPTASIEKAREGWREIFYRIQETLGQNDLLEAQKHLAKEMSKDAWQRLKILKKTH